MKILKFVIPNIRSIIKMPAGKIIHCASQRNNATLWIVDSDKWVDREFEVYYSGEEIKTDGLQYVGTILVHENIVWHVFERIKAT